MSKPRTARGEQTRGAILRETAALLGANEPETVTLDRISELVPIAKSSILWHFGSKEQLFLAVVDHVFSELIRSLDADVPADADRRTRLSSMFDRYARFLAENPHINTALFHLMFDRTLGPQVRDRIRDMYRLFRQAIVAQARASGIPASEDLAAAAVALVDGVFVQWLLDPERVEPRAVFEAVLDSADAWNRTTT